MRTGCVQLRRDDFWFSWYLHPKKIGSTSTSAANGWRGSRTKPSVCCDSKIFLWNEKRILSVIFENKRRELFFFLYVWVWKWTEASANSITSNVFFVFLSLNTSHAMDDTTRDVLPYVCAVFYSSQPHSMVGKSVSTYGDFERTRGDGESAYGTAQSLCVHEWYFWNRCCLCCLIIYNSCFSIYSNISILITFVEIVFDI